MPSFFKASPLMDATMVSNVFIAEYMPQAPDGFVKVYLFALMLANMGEADAPDIAAALGIDESALGSAVAFWQSRGLMRVVTDAPLTVELLAPWQAGGQEGRSPGRYAALVEALRGIAGTRIFSAKELSDIYDWIEVFRFDEDAAVLLVGYCLEKHGPRAKLWQLNAMAKLFADNGVHTVSDAEALIGRLGRRNAGAQRILARWNRPRPATDDELVLYAKWTDEWGLNEAAINEALANMTASMSPSFKYLDAILESYRMRGALSEEDINALKKREDAIRELARLMLERAKLKRPPTRLQRDEVGRWHEQWQIPAELLLFAAESAAESSQPFSEIRRLVEAWHEEGVATLEAARSHLESLGALKQRREGAKRGRALAYGQRKYTEAELQGIGIKLYDDEDR